MAQLYCNRSVNRYLCASEYALQRLLSERSDGYRRSEQTSERFGRFESSLVGVTGTLTVLCFALLCFALLCFALRVYHADRWAPCTVRRRRSSSTAVRHGRYARSPDPQPPAVVPVQRQRQRFLQRCRGRRFALDPFTHKHKVRPSASAIEQGYTTPSLPWRGVARRGTQSERTLCPS